MYGGEFDRRFVHSTGDDGGRPSPDYHHTSFHPQRQHHAIDWHLGPRWWTWSSREPISSPATLLLSGHDIVAESAYAVAPSGLLGGLPPVPSHRCPQVRFATAS